jgi:hypothetical protein
LELLETRLTPAGPLVIEPLNPGLDQFGQQIVTVQAYGNPSHATFSVFDTGSSAITFSAKDQAEFASLGAAIPILNPGGALAEGIGGFVTGDVSMPGTIIADGMHAVSMTIGPQGAVTFSIDLGATSGVTPAIQAAVGTATGSPLLPTLTGTPILEPSVINPLGLAADVLLQGSSFNFSSLIPGLTVNTPDLSFVLPTTQLSAGPGITGPVRIPMGFYGEDNYLYPGNLITSTPNLVQPNIQISSGGIALSDQRFLFDTGAQLTLISPAEALALGLDLSNPTTSITIQGVGGSFSVPGFTLDELDVPTSDGGTLQFTSVPVYVMNVAPGIDGLLGMNLFNNAHEMLFNPYDPAGPSVSLTFNASAEGPGIDPNQLGQLQALGVPFTSSLYGQSIPGIVEPNTLTVAAEGFKTTEGALFTATVGTVQDSDPTAQAKNLSATIDWGDGQKSAGAVTAIPQGGFNISGAHVYAEEGTYSFTITVQDNNGHIDSDSADAEVADAPLAIGLMPVTTPGEGHPFSGKVAFFTDADPQGVLGDYLATIDWGDGQTSPGTISLGGPSPGAFTVTGSHTYLEEGAYTPKVTVTDVGGSTVSNTEIVSILDDPIGVSAVPLGRQVEGIPFTAVLAQFGDTDPNAILSDYTATIYWGDGSSSGGAITPNNTGGFDISGSHTYAAEGSYNYAVGVEDEGGAGNGFNGIVIVTDAPLTGSGQSFSVTPNGAIGNAAIANFTDPGSSSTESPASYSATIDWGDGSTSSGIVSSASGAQPAGGGGSGSGTFSVNASHTYSTYGVWTVHTTVTDPGGSSIELTSQIQVPPHAAIIGRAQTSGQIWVGLSNGSSGFSSGLWSTWGSHVAWQDVHTADFNGDGLADIAGRDPATGKWYVGLSNGSGFSTSVWGVWSTGVTWADVRVADLNGDGKADIIGRDPRTGQWWAAISTGSSFQTSLWGTWSTAATWVDVVVGDFNGDGKADIAGRWLQGGQWWVAQSTGSSLASSLWAIWSTGVTWTNVEVGDFSGDGKADIVARALQTGDWWAAQSTGSNFTSNWWGQWSTGVTWVDVQVGDFNGDGKADIIGRAKESGAWWVGLSTGSGFAANLWTVWSTGVNWVDVQVGDFNGDGLSDLTARAQNTGQWWTSLSGGSTSSGTSLWATWSTGVTWSDVKSGGFG